MSANGSNGTAKVNGTNGAHVAARAEAPALTEVDLTAAAVAGQEALLADARGLLEEAAQARVRAEEAEATARQEHEEARRASDANLADDALLAAEHRAGRWLEAKQAEHGRAVQAHQAAHANVAQREAALGAAKRAQEIAQLEQRLSDSNPDYLRENIEPIVGLISGIGQMFVRLDEWMAERAELVARLRQLRYPLPSPETTPGEEWFRLNEQRSRSYPAPDTTPIAGVFAGVIHRLGGSLPVGFNENELRWLFDIPMTSPTRDRNGAIRARKLVDMTLRLLESTWAPGRERLSRIVTEWPRHHDRLRAEAAVRAIGERETAARVADATHEMDRVHAAKAEKSTRFAGFALRSDNSPIGPCRVCGKDVDATAVVDLVGERRALRHRTCAAPTEMPVVDRPPSPPGSWVDGEYQVEAWVKEPTVG